MICSNGIVCGRQSGQYKTASAPVWPGQRKPSIRMDSNHHLPASREGASRKSKLIKFVLLFEREESGKTLFGVCIRYTGTIGNSNKTSVHVYILPRPLLFCSDLQPRKFQVIPSEMMQSEIAECRNSFNATKHLKRLNIRIVSAVLVGIRAVERPPVDSWWWPRLARSPVSVAKQFALKSSAKLLKRGPVRCSYGRCSSAASQVHLAFYYIISELKFDISVCLFIDKNLLPANSSLCFY